MCIVCCVHGLTMAKTHAEERLIKKPNSKSVVWNYFGLKANEYSIILPEEEERSICRTCKKAVLAKGGNTSNLLTHLRDHYPDLHDEAVPHCSHTSTKCQSTLHDVIDKIKSMTQSHLELNN